MKVSILAAERPNVYRSVAERALAPKERNERRTLRSSGAFNVLCDAGAISIWQLSTCHELNSVKDLDR